MIAETGTSSMGLAFANLPHGARFYNHTLWGAIGWTTPAAFGAAVAAPQRRLVLITGEGSHQLTAQEIGLFHRQGLPIITDPYEAPALPNKMHDDDEPSTAWSDAGATGPNRCVREVG